VEIRARVGYLPQDPRFYEHMTAREMLTFTAKFFFKGPDPAIEDRVEEMLTLVGLTDKADRPIEGLSGGERQRVGIAQAQVSYPDLLILDEPAASLDPLGRRDVLQVMERLRKYTTIFYSTHILDDVQKVSDTVAILNHGELVAHGPIEALLSGGDGVVYVVRLRGDLESAHARVAAQPWVSEVQRRPLDGGSEWFVTVSDAEVAERRLLRLLLADEALVVGEFRRRAYELEDVFTSIVEGGSHVGQ
jgi:ABC-2 type transport system ATP-binding protein